MTRLTSSYVGMIGLALIVAACGSDSNGTSGDTGGAGGTAGTSGAAGASGDTNGGQGGTGGTFSGGGNGGTFSGGGNGGTFSGGGNGGTFSGGTGGSGGTAQGGGGTGGTAQGGGGTGGTAQGGGGTGGTGGTGGAGGQPPQITDPCNRVTWVATGNPTNNPANGIDGNLTTRWTTGADANGDESYTVKFPELVTLSGVTLNVTGNNNDYARAYTVDYSTNGTDFEPVLADDGGVLSGVGAVITNITFPQPTTLLAVRVNQTGVSTYWWSIREFTVNDCVEYSPDAGAPDAGGTDAATPPDAAPADSGVGDASLDGGG